MANKSQTPKDSKSPKKNGKVVLWSSLTAVVAILLVAAIVGNFVANYFATTLNVTFGITPYQIVKGDSTEDTEYFKSDFATAEELAAYDKLMGTAVEAEGATLLKNDNSALPLPSGAKVSLFARGSVDLLYGGTGSGAVDTSSAPNLKDALTQYGIEINQTLWDWYSGNSYTRVTPAAISDNLTANTLYGVNEAPWSEVQSAAGSSFAGYGDAAIVVFSRSGGEGADLPAGDIGAELTYTNSDGKTVAYTYGEDEGNGGNYLSLSTQEKELLAGLKALKDDGTFKRIIVLLNTSNALELDFLNPEVCGVDYGIDSCMWIGDVGQWGALAIGQLLSGQVAPSGSLVDTYLYDNLATPAIHNFYSQPYSGSYELEGADSANVQAMYSVYQEGIYLGYRYFETRYEDKVMGTGNAGSYDYTKTVAYPFGYGISYTTFEYSDFSVAENGDSFDVTVTVKNTGSAAAKKTVQVYFQSPFTDYDKENRIEKAAVELCGFTKTGILQPGESATVTVSVPKTQLRTYDAYGAKTYILDAGDYYFTVGNGAHEALNNILAAKGYTTDDGMDAEGNAAMTYKWTQDALDTTVFATAVTGNAITNLFDQADPNRSGYWDGDVVKFMSRTDWEGTYPTKPAELAMTDKLAAALQFIRYTPDTYQGTALAEYGTTTGADNGLALASMIGKSFDDPDWYKLLDQMSVSEMIQVITLGFHNTAAVPTIGKAATHDENGPQGLTTGLTGGGSATCYTSEDIMAATMNIELITDLGRCIGEDCLTYNPMHSGLYGPGINMHRTAYSGRNFEYYSEDPFVAGATCAAETAGIQSKGVYVYLKHVALNDSESSRRGVNTWLTEQAAREIYLEVADMAITDQSARTFTDLNGQSHTIEAGKGGAWCTMSGFNRWGALWCGEYYELQTSYLRGEAGMRGMSITDFSGSSQYMDVPDALLAGSDLWDSPMPKIHTNYANENFPSDDNMIAEMKEAMHYLLYTVANSNAMNGLSSSDRIKMITPWWQIAIWALIAVLAVATCGCGWMLYTQIKTKKAKKA